MAENLRDSQAELTTRAIVLGLVLSAVMAAANAYLGLRVGMTVSASIPSAVLSMLILRALRNSGVLENNLVQTAASAGESLAAGFIFTVPALLILNVWQEVKYFESALVIALGGILGVLFSIPMRQVLIEEEKLQFPEGVATAKILHAGHASGSRSGNQGKWLLGGILIGALVKVCEGVFSLWKGVFEGAILIKTAGLNYFAYFGAYLSPALIGVGFIVGPAIAIPMFIGGVVGWYLGLPAFYYLSPDVAAETKAVETAYSYWSSSVRYLGVGAMCVGGFWTLLSLRGSLASAFKKLSEFSSGSEDISGKTCVALLLLVVAGVSLALYTLGFNALSVALSLIIVLVAAYLFSLVAGYMAGLVGSSNNPVSGITIATICAASGLFLLFGLGESDSAPLGIVLIGAFVCCAAALSGDNLQDLKAGAILGANPRKQQVMQILGVVAAALVIPFVVQVLQQQHAIGSKEFVAPQASLIAEVVRGFFGGSLPLNNVLVGAVFAALVIGIDLLLKARGKMALPVLAVAVGLYLPLAISVTILLGGGIRYFLEKRFGSSIETIGVLAASGLITGEALTGVALAGLALL